MISRMNLRTMMSLTGVLATIPAMGSLAAQPEPAFGAEPVVRYDGHQVVRVKVSTPAQLMRLSGVAESFWSHRIGLGEQDVQIRREAADVLRAVGLEPRVLIEDVQTLIDAERAQIEASREVRGSWFATYRTLPEINAYMSTLATSAGPAVATWEVCATSIEGREIRALRLSAPDLPGNPRSSRPQVVFNGGQHAREWVSPMTLVFIADRLVAGYQSEDARIRALLEQAEIVLIPVVNPDGYLYSWSTQRLWRKNRRNNGNGTFGVDLNRNWGVGWGGNDGSSGNTSSDTYRGTAPFSEPETAGLRDYMTALGRVEGHIDFHSYSQLILSPWGYTTQLPPDALLFDSINAELEAVVEGVNGFNYTAGPTATTIYIASGGSSDWSYGQLGALGYAIELRDEGQFGFVLPADQIIPTAEENTALALRFAEIASTGLRITPVGSLPVTVPAGQTTTIDFIFSDGAGVLDVLSPELLVRVLPGGSPSVVPMTLVSGRTYRATLPAASCGRTIEYSVRGRTTSGRVTTFPSLGVLNATSSSPAVVQFDDPCETVGGWVVGAAGDNATTGIWGNMDPQATAAQPENDRTPSGTRCWVTDGRAGTGVGTYDVDGGTTTLTSPAMDARTPTGFVGDAYVSYWVWYSNDQGANPNSNSMPVLISGDNGATWRTLETISASTNAWAYREFRVADFVTPGSQVRLRFQARDLTGAVVEAAVDDVRVEVRGCASNPADFDGDGFVDFFDFDAYVQCFEGGACPAGKSADFDGDGFVDFFDFDAFVAAFENG
jgi:murein tripeptide amidase MpaA